MKSGQDGCYNFHVPPEIKTIKLTLPFRLGKVNCYLIKTASGCVLIDTGCANARAQLEKELLAAGCTPGELKFIVLTHGDFDHSGNAAYLRKKFGAKIAMHHDDAVMVERGDIFGGRQGGNFILRVLALPLFRFRRSDRFKPDLYLEDGDDLAEYGLEARVLHIPGHSRGSIGVVTTGGQLFSGDLLVRKNRPKRNSLIDDPAAASDSIERLKGLRINTVYPGHGRSFPAELMP
jgi:hydroxyacylglutathione hydrolase